jgi:serine protease Do
MKRILASLLSLIVLGLWTSHHLHAQQTRSPQIVKLFNEVVSKPAKSTVRVIAGDKEVALGVVVSSDGWILTKHSELKGNKLTVKLPDGATHDAVLHGHDVPFDLAMLKIDVNALTPVEWTDSKAAKVGHWVASAGLGEEVVAIGVVSVGAREVKGAKFTPPAGTGQGGYLGIALDLDFAGVKVQEVFPNTPGQKAGLKADDQIIKLNGEAVMSADDFLALLGKHKPDDKVKLTIARDDKEQDLSVTLGQRPGSKGGKSRSDVQNSMGSKLSDRRAGFPIILQHDSIIKPSDCGGPLVNLDGKVLGINIARAGRTESYAIPSEAVRPLLEKLKTKNAAKDAPK